MLRPRCSHSPEARLQRLGQCSEAHGCAEASTVSPACARPPEQPDGKRSCRHLRQIYGVECHASASSVSGGKRARDTDGTLANAIQQKPMQKLKAQ